MEKANEKLNALTITITGFINEFQVNARKAGAGNKAAGVRARKLTLELEKKFKLWRKTSMPE